MTSPLPRIGRVNGFILLIAFGVSSLASAAAAERLVIDHYGTADGLPHNRVSIIYPDRKGYVWFGTEAGLSRFDGYQFINYGQDEGLPNVLVNDIVEDRNGDIWVATRGGVARLVERPEPNPSGPSRVAPAHRLFASYQVDEAAKSNNVLHILFDDENGLWCATRGGLYYAPASQNGQRHFTPKLPHVSGESAVSAHRDREGRLWFAYAELLIRVAGGDVAMYPAPPLPKRSGAADVIEHRRGRLLVAYLEEGVWEFVVPPPGEHAAWTRLPLKLEPRQAVRALFADVTGVVWIGTSRGLVRYHDGAQTAYSAGTDVHDEIVRDVVADREGNLWIGTSWGGAFKVAAPAIVRFDGDGLPSEYFTRILEDRHGRIYAFMRDRGSVEVIGDHLQVVSRSIAEPFRSIAEGLQDARGEWWLSTRRALFRVPGPALEFGRAKRLTADDGVREGTIHFIEQDPAGRVWTSIGGTLHRFDNGATARPVGIAGRFDGMLVDRGGTTWLASMDSAIMRWTDGRAPETVDGLPRARVKQLFQDSRGWLWIVQRNEGASVTMEPAAVRPAFKHFTRRNGLASDDVAAITEDRFGRIYLATDNGLDRLDPLAGTVRHYTRADGLPAEGVFHCLTDHRGDVWVATTSGLARLTPRGEGPSDWQPNVYLTGIHAGGVDMSVPERGSTELPAINLRAWTDSLTIQYVGLRFRRGPRLKYQYRLDGLDENWNRPTEQRAVTYAQLGPGSYRFLVRAINPDDGVTSTSAVLPLEIPVPIWMRWWFVALVAISLVTAALGVHRWRVRQIFAMERVRRQIATDLHDDVGSGLAQIAILSEVAKRRTPADAAPLLTETAALARSMRESMSDIVWSIDPTKDRAADLVRRMKQACFNSLQSNGTDVEFLTPDEATLNGIGLTADRRRHLLLIFKETIANAARHAHAAQVRIVIEAAATELRLRIEDDGPGFDPREHVEGHGLHSIRQRALMLNARLEIDAAPGRGTRVHLTVPLK